MNSNSIPQESVPRQPTGSFHDHAHHDSEPSPSLRTLDGGDALGLTGIGGMVARVQDDACRIPSLRDAARELSRTKAAEGALVGVDWLTEPLTHL